ncbi:MAG: GTP cyclohydrolase I FolE2 [Thermodesulfobacteria bacterium]|nr:GTP cyclohydrolase I FolE2 [Thermodesulfobacteriota bacterium]
MEKCSRLVSFPEEKWPDLRPEFDESRHQRVIDSCEDIPETRPAFPYPINRVGITDKTLWINLPEGCMPFSSAIYVDLPSGFRGIHMSRMEQQISKLCQEQFCDICQFAECLAQKILEEQQGSTARISLEGLMPLRWKTAISKRISLDSIKLSADVTVSKEKGENRKRSLVGLALVHITACPCTQVYLGGLFGDKAKWPYPTHSQRCVTWLRVERDGNEPSYEDLLECLTSCLHPCQDLLKRPDEAELVLKSHREPQFAEDTVRLVARQVGLSLGNQIASDGLIEVNTTSYESIHNHNVACHLETTLKQIQESL